MRAPLQEVLENIEVSRLPSFPNVLVELLAACRAPEADFEALSRLIDKDTGLTAKVIDAVNAPVYGLRQQIRSLERTLVVLGLDSIKTIAITSAVQQFFGNLHRDRSAFLKRFWRHSLMCAALARCLAKLTDYPSSDEAYFAGLLHDVGQLVLDGHSPDQYLAVQLSAAERGDLRACEQEHFGVGHHEVGYWLVRNWNLDSFMADAVLYHHEPADRLLDAHPLVRLIHVANQLADSEGFESAGADSAQTLFGLTGELVREHRAHVAEEVADTAASLGIDIGPAETYERRQEVQAQDAAVQQRLSDEVRTIGLLDGVRQQLLQGGTRSVLEIIHDSTRLLFDVERVLLFLRDDSGGPLRGVALDSQDRLTAELVIPQDAGRGIAARAAAERKPVHSFSDAEPSVFDRQLIGLSHREGILCVPMMAAESVIGLLVLSIDRHQVGRFEAQMALLQAYATELARALRMERVRERQQREAAEEYRAGFEADTRKLVHEAKNPLQIIQNYLGSLGAKLEQGHPAQEDLRTIREEIERVGAILEQMTAVGAPGRAPGRAVDVNRLIGDLVRMMQRSVFEGRGIETQLHLDPQLPALALSGGALRQVLLNLMKNAAEALGEGGRVVIGTRDRVNFDGRDCIEITVSDNGPGIPPEVAAKLFQPVKSTKGGEHAGLGLTIAHNLIKQLNGSIGCHSEASAGTTFQILLPRILESQG